METIIITRAAVDGSIPEYERKSDGIGSPPPLNVEGCIVSLAFSLARMFSLDLAKVL